MVRYLSWTPLFIQRMTAKPVSRQFTENRPTKTNIYILPMQTPPRTQTTSSPYLAHSTIPEEKWELLVGYLEHKLSVIRTLMHQAMTLATNDKDDIKGDDQPRKICPLY